jgi:hypothetical protein
MKMVRHILFLLMCSLLLGGLPLGFPAQAQAPAVKQPDTVSPKNELSSSEVSDGWVLLYDGKSLNGWTALGDKAKWGIARDADLRPLEGEDGWIMNERVFSNFILKLEFKVPAASDSGVYFRASDKGDPGETGYEVRIHNDDPKYSTGSLVGLVAARPVAPEPGKWHSFEIEARGDHIVVKLDDETIVDGRYPKSKSGHIGFQYKKGDTVELRNIKVKPL